MKTGERLVPDLYRSEPEYILYLRHLFAYRFAAAMARADQAILDVGSGTGYGTRLLAETGAAVIGTDIDDASISEATAAYGTERCSFVPYDGRRLPFEEGAFNMVTSFQTIEHVEDDRNFVAEVRRVLRPGGTFVLTTPNRLTRVPVRRKPWNRFHVREYTPADLRVLLESSFARTAIEGVRASAAIESIERKRVAAANRIAGLDPLNLRHLVPAALIAVLANRRSDRTSDRDLERFTRTHSLDDFYASSETVEDAMDLMAICR